MHRVARQHQTVASSKLAATNSEQWWEHRPGDRVRTIDGPGRVVAINDGPFPGAEEYHIELDGGLGGGAYQPGQITKMLPTMASTEHTADMDYPELGTLLYDRPDPAALTYTAAKTPPGWEGAQGPFEDEYTEPHVYARDIHSGAGNCVCGAGLEDDLHLQAAPGVDLPHREASDDAVYLRFGDWPKNERSHNNVTGHPEEGVSVYDLDHEGNPVDPDASLDRWHQHDSSCEPYCDLDQWNDEYGNDTRDEMNGRVDRAERNRYNGRDLASDTGHLVKGTMVGVGHDGEPLLNNVRRVGDWIDHRHLFAPKAEPHRLARSPYDEDYEPPKLGKHADLTGQGDPGSSMTPGATVSDEGNDNGSWPPEYNNALYHRKDDIPKVIASSSDVDCYVGHEGPCPSVDEGFEHRATHHLGMPSKRHPGHDEKFDSHVERLHGERGGNGWPLYKLVGTLNGKRVGHIAYGLHPSGNALKVEMLHTDSEAKGRGVAAAMMDHLHEKNPQAWVNHGWRTYPGWRGNGPKSNGLAWWRSYDDPAPERNVHNVHPDKGWGQYFNASDVAGDIRQNDQNDPGHYDEIGGVPSWAQDESYRRGHHDDASKSYVDDEDKNDYKEKDKEEPAEEHYPDPRESYLTRGMAVHLSPESHRIVHNSALPTHVRAQHLLDVIGRGDMPTSHWESSESNAWGNAGGIPETGRAHTPPTHVVLHAAPFEHREVHDEDGDPVFQSEFGQRVHFDTTHKPINFGLSGISWGNGGGGKITHSFDHPEPVGMPLQEYHHVNLRQLQERQQTRQEHKERYQTPDRGPGIDPGTGEQKKLFASSLPSIEAISDERRKELRNQATDPAHYKELLRGEIAKDREHKRRTDEFLDEKFGPEMPTPRGYHPAWGGSTPQDDLFGRLVGTEEGVSEDVEDAIKDRQTLRSLNHLLVTATMDTEFRFHFTAGWRDVQAKARRIRSEGRVNITHADDLMVIGNVQGDHHVYETGLQRHPGRRTSVAVYSCGCKWGAYHWGAPDDLSRFAGRMCSHALALQYEAQSRGMFGHDVEVDQAPAKWVPSRVVVKYDIDDKDNLYARAALRGVPEQPPHLVALAALEDDDPALPAILAATNELFGGGVVESNPTNMNIYGPTVTPNPNESPASAGPFSGGEPSNWGSITTNMLARTRIASVMHIDAFWHRLAESLMGEEGAEATLHEEPQGALPETDGHVRLATPDEARDEDYTPEQRDLDPLVASLGDVELTEHTPSTLGGNTPDAGDLEPDYQSIQTQGSETGIGAGIGSIEGTDVEEMGEPEAINVLDRVASVSDIVAEFQKSAGAQALQSGNRPSGGGGFDDIAGAAQAYLTKTAASFSAAERQALIEESPGVQAANTDRLNLEGTHYALLDDETDDAGWLA
jgi:hypothetical protein